MKSINLESLIFFSTVKKIPIFIQPIDEYDQKKNQQNIQRIDDLSMQNGYLVSLQIHKILNIR